MPAPHERHPRLKQGTQRITNDVRVVAPEHHLEAGAEEHNPELQA